MMAEAKSLLSLYELLSQMDDDETHFKQDLILTENVKYRINELFRKIERDKSTKNYFTDAIQFECREKEELKRNPTVDESLRVELFLKETENGKYLKMMDFRQKLPSYKAKRMIVNLVERNQVVLLSGETGCGKTTQVPQFILDNEIEKSNGSMCRIICTQPRRISAISVAERVAKERAEICGLSAGYQIRFESKWTRNHGTILFCTTGIVLEWMKRNPKLNGVSHLILDEIHERDLRSDFLLILVKDLLPLRPDLKVILMSATLNAVQFSNYFGNCPHLTIPGCTFPVKEYLLEDVYETLKTYKVQVKRFQRRQTEEEKRMRELYFSEIKDRYSHQTIFNLRIHDDLADIDHRLIFELIKHISTKEGEGAILVFLPGWQDINQVDSLLQKDAQFLTSNYVIIPLHSEMPTVEQKEIFERPPKGVRKIVLSTNIAETGITIDDVVFVIDSGKMKMRDFDKKRDVHTLDPVLVSLANAQQRRGRAGRVQPGICYHLFSGFTKRNLPKFHLPEILRTRLEEICLQIKILKLGKINEFLGKAMDKPELVLVKLSIEFLQKLEALDEDEELTVLGNNLARLPVDPQTAKMILFGAMFSCLDPILTVAASLSEKDPFFCPLRKELEVDEIKKKFAEGNFSDHIVLINAMKGFEKACRDRVNKTFCFENFLSPQRIKTLFKLKGQLAQELHRSKFVASPYHNDPESNANSDNTKLISAILVAGLHPNVAKLNANQSGMLHNFTGDNTTAKTPDGESVTLGKRSVNSKKIIFASPYLVYYSKMKMRSNVFLFDTTVVSAFALILFGGGKMKFLMNNGEPTLCMNDWMKFHCSERDFQMIERLRTELRKMVDKKLASFGRTEATSEIDGEMLEIIKCLLASEQLAKLE